jgi:hypothetical protein
MISCQRLRRAEGEEKRQKERRHANILQIKHHLKKIKHHSFLT